MRLLSATLRWALSVCALGACSSDKAEPQSTTGTLTTCDPGAPVPLPITLGKVLAVGEDTDGTLYVIGGADRAEALDRLFISEGTSLQRERVVGSEARDGSDFTVSWQGSPSASRLVVKRSGSVVTGIALAELGGEPFFDELPASATRLKVVDAKRLAGLALNNLPGEVFIVARAIAEDGSQLVITRPRDDWSDADFRVFYGMGAVLSERKVDPSVDLPTSYRLVEFFVDGERYRAKLPPQPLTPGFRSSLTTPRGEAPLFLANLGAGLPADVSFECFD